MGRSLLPKISRRSTEILLHITAKVTGRRESIEVGQFGKRALLVAQLATDVKHCVAVNPVIGRKAAYLLAHLRKIFRCDKEFVGIICYFAVFAVITLLQQSQETLHQFCILRCDLLVPIQRCMEVKEIDNHALDGIDHGVTMEVVSCQCQASLDVVEVECAPSAEPVR